MAKFEKLILKILQGSSDLNISFHDLQYVLEHLDFKERTKGSHHIYSKAGIAEILNLQPKSDGKAKPYQVKQVREVIIKYKLTDIS